jgi:excisionase family DNA binding protein
MEQYLRIQEAAKFLRAHPGSLHRWVREGKLPAYKTGNYFLFSEKDLRNFVKPVVVSRLEERVN